MISSKRKPRANNHRINRSLPSGSSSFLRSTSRCKLLLNVSAGNSAKAASTKEDAIPFERKPAAILRDAHPLCMARDRAYDSAKRSSFKKSKSMSRSTSWSAFLPVHPLFRNLSRTSCVQRSCNEHHLVNDSKSACSTFSFMEGEIGTKSRVVQGFKRYLHPQFPKTPPSCGLIF